MKHQITFERIAGPEDGQSVACYSYFDRTSDRYFRVRELCGPVAQEVVAGVVVSEEAIRFFPLELIPTGRLVLSQLDEVVDLVDPDKEWAGIRNTPSKAAPAVIRMLDKNLGFKPSVDQAGYSHRMITYDSLDECAVAIQNAIDADVWLCSEEPVRRYTLAPRTEIEFETKAALDASPGGEKILRTIDSLSKHLGESEKMTISSYLERTFLHVDDAQLKYPVSSRLLVFFNAQGQPTGEGFTRGGWDEVAHAHFGFMLEDFDGAAGFSNGRTPRLGQIITHSGIRPPAVTVCELVHNEFVDTNKLFGRVQVNGSTYFVRGKIIAGGFTVQKLPPKEDGADYVLGRLRRGAIPIIPEQIPHFWNRLNSATIHSNCRT